MYGKKTIIEDERKYLLNTYTRPDFVLDHGKGVYLYDTDGKKYLDFVSGIAVNALGYGDKSLLAAIMRQAEKMIHCSNLYHFAPTVELARLIVQNSFADKVFFCNSGTEAVEGAIKFARKWGKKVFNDNKYEIIATNRSFHGRTLGALASTGKKEIRTAFTPMVPGFKHVDFNNLDAMEKAVTAKTCAIIVEPVQGEGGIYPAEIKYLKGLRKLCNDKGLLLIFDEIQCGLGRTGETFAYQGYGVKPDMLTLAKPIGGGLPMGAVLLKDNVAQYIGPGDHGSTFGANPVVSAAARVILTKLLKTDLKTKVKETGRHLKEQLRGLKKKYRIVTDVRGKGLMLGMECALEAGPVVTGCAAAGLLVVAAGKNTVRFVPPLVISKKHVDEAVRILDGVLAGLEKE